MTVLLIVAMVAIVAIVVMVAFIARVPGAMCVINHLPERTLPARLNEFIRAGMTRSGGCSVRAGRGAQRFKENHRE